MLCLAGYVGLLSGAPAVHAADSPDVSRAPAAAAYGSIAAGQRCTAPAGAAADCMAPAHPELGTVPRTMVVTVENRSPDGAGLLLGAASAHGPVRWKHGPAEPGARVLLAVPRGGSVHVKGAAPGRPAVAEVAGVDDAVRPRQMCEASGQDTWCVASQQLGVFAGRSVTVTATGDRPAVLHEDSVTAPPVTLAPGQRLKLPAGLRELVVAPRSGVEVTEVSAAPAR